MRKDVQVLAERLSNVSGINSVFLYDWLMDVGRQRGVNPRKIPFSAAYGRVIALDNPDQDYIEVFNPTTKKSYCDYDGPDYEELILARQEAWMD